MEETGALPPTRTAGRLPATSPRGVATGRNGCYPLHGRFSRLVTLARTPSVRNSLTVFPRAAIVARHASLSLSAHPDARFGLPRCATSCSRTYGSPGAASFRSGSALTAGIRREHSHHAPRLGPAVIEVSVDSAQTSNAASASTAWSAARAKMTVSWVGQSRATIPPAVRNRAGSGAGSSKLRSAGAVHAMRGVLPGAPTCAVERGATPANPLATTACAAVGPRARAPAAVGVQVVAGSNPVAPTISQLSPRVREGKRMPGVLFCRALT